MDRRVALSVAAVLVLAALVAQLNHYLAALQLHVWIGGLYVGARCPEPAEAVAASHEPGQLDQVITRKARLRAWREGGIISLHEGRILIHKLRDLEMLAGEPV